MPVPLVAIGAGVAAGGLASSILGKKKNKVPQIDTTALNNIVDAGGMEQRRIVSGTQPRLREQTDRFVGDTQGAVDRTTEERQNQNNSFLASLKTKRNALDTEQFNRGAEQIRGGVKPAQDALREVLAGSGVGLQGGAAIRQLSQPVLQAESQVTDLASMLSQNAAQAEMSATEKVYDNDLDFGLQKLGIDRDTYNAVLSSGRTDLINEMNAYLGESEQRTSDKLGIEQLRQTNNIASASAANADRTARNNALIGAGTSLVGYGMTPKAQPSQSYSLEQLMALLGR